MGTLEIVSLAVTFAVIVAGLLVLLVIVRQTPRSAAGALIGRGDFAGALSSAELGPRAGRDELLAAAVAAKHLLRLETAEALVQRILEVDDGDGEAWMERGLIAAYRGDNARAAEWLASAERHRSDLFESITLHRAWVDLRSGRGGPAARRFEEISAPLESKLRSDLGPGDPLFAEWFFQAADLWQESGAPDKSAWARQEARRSAPQSALVARFTQPDRER